VILNKLSRKTSLRSRLSFTILVMGLFALASAITTGEFYRHLIIENQKQAISTLIEHETQNLLHEYEQLVSEFGRFVQKSPDFKTHVKNKNIPALNFVLNEQFHQYYVTASVLDIHQIYLFDKDYNLITQSSEGTDFNMDHLLCQEHQTIAKQRQGIERIKTSTLLCRHMGVAVHSMIQPIGTLQPVGYVQIISNPVSTLKDLEKSLAMPVGIVNYNDKPEFASSNWSMVHNNPENYIRTSSILKDNQQQSVYIISAAQDIQQLNLRINNARKLIIALMAFATIIVMGIFLFLLERSTLSPLAQLRQRLHMIREDKKLLGSMIETDGAPEIRDLGATFNVLSVELRSLYEKLEYLAFTDALTSLPNRTRLQEQLEFQCQQYDRHNQSFALLMMDLDRFKNVNDTLGHAAGDELLILVSDRLSQVFRKSDMLTRIEENDRPIIDDKLARLGGDEFAAVLTGVSSKDEAALVCKKILDAMQKPFVINNCNFSIGISIGVALCPEHGIKLETLMRHADIAMYRTKTTQEGYCFYDNAFDKHSIGLLSLTDDLRNAIQQEQFQLVYQPKIDLLTKKVIGVEALLRWTHPLQGPISPDVFIPLAEQSGVINEITYWVVNAAVAQKKQWVQNNINLSIAINLSARNLLDHELCQNIINIIRESEIRCDQFYLELTETALITDPQRSLARIVEFNRNGFKISIDDFGTGYSSLSFLKQLPVHEIKIDRSFVMAMEEDRNDAIIVRSTIDLAHNMGLQVIAEGVETENILDSLSRHACDLVQGFYLAKPMPIAELEAWLASSSWGLGKL